MKEEWKHKQIKIIENNRKCVDAGEGKYHGAQLKLATFPFHFSCAST